MKTVGSQLSKTSSADAYLYDAIKLCIVKELAIYGYFYLLFNDFVRGKK